MSKSSEMSHAMFQIHSREMISGKLTSTDREIARRALGDGKSKIEDLMPFYHMPSDF
jgi:hypothetical protein